jgi:hypothetical protein
MKGFLQDNKGNYSSMRLSYLVCMMLSSALVLAGIVGLFLGKDITSILSTSVLLATIGTAGKNIQNKSEEKR